MGNHDKLHYDRERRLKLSPSMIPAVIPELSIFVFIGVCAALVIYKDGPAAHLTPLVFALAVNLFALNKIIRRRP